MADEVLIKDLAKQIEQAEKAAYKRGVADGRKAAIEKQVAKDMKKATDEYNRRISENSKRIEQSVRDLVEAIGGYFSYEYPACGCNTW